MPSHSRSVSRAYHMMIKPDNNPFGKLHIMYFNVLFDHCSLGWESLQRSGATLRVAVCATGASGLQKGTGVEGQSRNWSLWGEEAQFILLDMMQRKLWKKLLQLETDWRKCPNLQSSDTGQGVIAETFVSTCLTWNHFLSCLCYNTPVEAENSENSVLGRVAIQRRHTQICIKLWVICIQSYHEISQCRGDSYFPYSLQKLFQALFCQHVWNFHFFCLDPCCENVLTSKVTSV